MAVIGGYYGPRCVAIRTPVALLIPTRAFSAREGRGRLVPPHRRAGEGLSLFSLDLLFSLFRLSLRAPSGNAAIPALDSSARPNPMLPFSSFTFGGIFAVR